VPGRVSRKWRPPLALVLGGALAAVLALPLMGLATARLLAPALGPGGAQALVVGAVVGATALLAFLLWRLLYRPITALAARARAVTAGDGGPPAPLAHYGTAEFSELGRSVLEMTEALRNREAAVRSFTDHAAHELKAPLTGIIAAAELLAASKALGAEDRRLAETVHAAAARMQAGLDALRRAAAAREPVHRGTSSLAEVLPALAADFPGLAVVHRGGAVALPLGAEGLAIVLTQLLRNAAEHGARRVEIAAREGAEGPALRLADDGPGVSEGNRARLFEPFFTTRREAGGTGMGLAIVAGLLRAHGGAIRLLPGAPGTGAAFEITF
jgi:signal transduction histidine kinase